MSVFYIYATLTEDKQLLFSNVTPMSQGENLTTAIRITVPADWQNYDFYLEFSCPQNRRYISPLLEFVTDNETQMLHYDVAGSILEREGLVLVQIVARDATDNSILFKSRKSTQSSFTVNASICATASSYSTNDFVSNANSTLSQMETLATTLEENAAQATLAAQNANSARTQLLSDKANGVFDGAVGATGATPAISVTATTLQSGENATVSKSGTNEQPVFSFGIPKGDVGSTPSISVSVTTLSAGSSATVTQSGTAENVALEFGIPKGDSGAQGIQGERGIQGVQGERGIQGKSYRNRGEYDSSVLYVNDATWIDTFTYSGSAYYCKATAPIGTSPLNIVYFGVFAAAGADGGVTVDSELNENSENPVKNSVLTQTLRDSYQTKLGAETVKVTDSFLTRISAGYFNEIRDNSYSKITSIKGSSSVWNQLIPLRTTTSLVNGITFASTGNGVWTLNGTATATANFYVRATTSYPAGHKLLLTGVAEGMNTDLAYLLESGSGDGTASSEGKIITSASTLGIYVQVANGAVLTDVVFKPQLFDLTEIYGAGNEPSGENAISEFRHNYPNGYYTFNAGTLINSTVRAIKSVGNNLFAGNSTESTQYIGHYYVNSTGALSSSTEYNAFRFRVSADSAYYLFNSNSTPMYEETVLRFEDANNELISFSRSLYRTTGGTFTTPSNCCYLVLSAYGTATAQVQINNGSTALPYQNYWTDTLDFGQAYELKGVGTAQDEINFETQKKTVRVGSVDMGTLNWDLYSTNKFCCSLPNAKKINPCPNLLCADYSTVTGTMSSLSNKQCVSYLASGTQYLGVMDTGYDDYVEFKSAMSGKILYFELETATESDISIRDNYLVDNWGEETILSAVSPETTAFVAPSSTVCYSKDIGAQVKTNTELISENRKLLSEIQSIVLALQQNI